MSALPKAVQVQIDRANEISELIHATPPELDADGKPIVPEQLLDADGQPVAVKPEIDKDAQIVEPEVDKPADPDHKYKVLQGKYNAEVPRLQSELKESREQVAELRQRINNTESLIASMNAVAPPAEPEAPTLPGITDEEREQFGPDLIDVIERVSAAKILPQVDSRLAPVDSRVRTVEQSAGQAANIAARSERDRVLTTLAGAVPEWETQNEQPEFLAWLNENDAYAGVPRGRLLTEAFQANDANRVIAFFKGFQTENAVVTPSVSTPPVVEPQVNLADVVAPGTPKTGTTSAPNESGKRQWSRKEISSFYAAKNEFVKIGKSIPADYVAAEKDLIKAQAEGRITP
jgi:hypothetical protein